MSHLKKSLVLGICSALVLILVFGCSSGEAKNTPGTRTPQPTAAGRGAPVNGLVQSTSAGSVDISAEWVGVSGGTLRFIVELNTHSVDLDKYDLSKMAVVRDDTGEEYTPFSWKAALGGHHRSGTLEVPLPVSVEQGKARFVQMIIRGIAGEKESTLQWNLA